MKEYINSLMVYFVIMSAFFCMRKDKSSFFFEFITGSVVLLMMHIILSLKNKNILLLKTEMEVL